MTPRACGVCRCVMDGMIAAALFNWSDFMGPFHVVMLHYPIGFLTLAVLLEAWVSWRPSVGGRAAVGFTLGLSAAVSWLVVWLGFMRAAHGEFDPEVVRAHKVFGVAVAVMSTLCWWLHRQLYPPAPRALVRHSYRGLLGLSLICLVVAGHQGGTLTHGKGFLSEGAPPELAQVMAAVEPTPMKPAPTSGSEFATVIQPVFARKCFQCHGPEKQKAHYRLDEQVTALKGGSSGEAAIVPGKPWESHLVKVLFLAPEAEGSMPPEGKERLTPEELMAVVRWIQNGAKFDVSTSPGG